ncbi:zinc finger protein 836-like [Condylostylus longicornis]|uniref:zinc finger protein 836-like n=1 Tax=Condylostylus longicornis TaxID=2530218 RepID=UPI00244DB296|nr:zinc finger protein 836-like [Condylostylus longicornis]
MQKISWRKWCISCGKQNDSDLNIDLCSKDVGTGGSSVLKYLQLVMHDETKFYSGKICLTCYSTISFIVQFNNHVTKVQKMFLEFEKYSCDQNICLESLQKKIGLISQSGIQLDFLEKNDGIFPPKFLVKQYDTDEVSEENKRSNEEEEDIKPIIENETAKTEGSTYQVSPNEVFVIENNSFVDDTDTATTAENEVCDVLSNGDENSFNHDLSETEKKFICPKCSKEFKLKRYLDNHFRRVHKQNKSFRCNSCTKTFESRECLREHSKLHKEERKYKCPDCDKAFKHKQDLNVHSATHDGIGCICQICGVKCKTKNVLRSHMVVHSDTKKYKCKFCSKEFKRSKEFKYHLILHTGLKPYQCPFCDLKFPNRPNCRKHEKKAHPKELAEQESKGQPKFFKSIPSITELNELVLKKEC